MSLYERCELRYLSCPLPPLILSPCLALQVKVACTQDVLNVMEIGQRNRSVAETKMNERSSRSHSVLTIIVDGLNNVTGIRTHGCLHLIDLAGKASFSSVKSLALILSA